MARKQQRRRPRFPVNGWLVLDKPLTLTSNDALGQLKRIFHPEKVGHAGTLDPLATGCLPIAFGEATKTVPHVMDGRKVYRFEVTWGTQTTSDDAEGEAVKTSDVRPTSDEIQAVLPDFRGRIEQTPPIFSAIKVDGNRAYDLAREGEDVKLEPRVIEVHRLDLVECPDQDRAIFEAECGKGTYVRALARDLGERLGTCGYVTDLRRLLVGPFGEEQMVTLDELRAAKDAMAVECAEGEEPPLQNPLENAELMEAIKPVEIALHELQELRISPDAAARVKRGNSILLRGADAPIGPEEIYVISGGKLIAFGEVAKGEFKPRRVFNL
ncbi:tRNA pseudouridine synthase B [Pseudovibrio axinellae]|uniref:tRNA pseudouridine synthase B n=1 Tax=Pseudovibrio axinellae TaxID=989403 RepID=A0A165Z8I9_9HYPH|nr:tRNA pseudouridine(55) synthase TruB [Pseudovibrio axinellae]KZL19602.1 tRNA pseudouridine synthase B [Pseudovibrio axinellae]SEQ33765.1 tRNA pseudouridine synthase B [Pseudovibrio axinellae]